MHVCDIIYLVSQDRKSNMLKIFVGDLPDQITFPEFYFDHVYEDSWFEDPFVKKIIKDIDNTDATSAYQMTNPVWGALNYTMLSTGCKNVILAYKTDNIIYATKMGDNCSPLLLSIANMKDVTIILHHVLHFPCDFSALFLNSNKMIHTLKEYTFEVVRLLTEWHQALMNEEG